MNNYNIPRGESDAGGIPRVSGNSGAARSLFRDRPISQVPEERQPYHFAMGRLEEHIDPTAQDGEFQAAGDHTPRGHSGKAEERADGDIDQQPDNK